MKNKIGRLNSVTYLIFGIVCLLMGIILIINPDFTLTGLCSVVGAVLIVAGVILMILYFAKAGYRDHESADFAVTTCMILGGILILIRKEDISSIFPQFLAVFVLLSGVLKMQQAMDLVGYKNEAWLWHFLIGLIVVVLCGLVLIMPTADWFQSRDRVPLYMCILLAADGAVSIFCLIHATACKNQYRKEHPEEFVEVIDEKKKED